MPARKKVVKHLTPSKRAGVSKPQKKTTIKWKPSKSKQPVKPMRKPFTAGLKRKKNTAQRESYLKRRRKPVAKAKGLAAKPTKRKRIVSVSMAKPLKKKRTTARPKTSQSKRAGITKRGKPISSTRLKKRTATTTRAKSQRSYPAKAKRIGTQAIRGRNRKASGQTKRRGERVLTGKFKKPQKQAAPVIFEPFAIDAYDRSFISEVASFLNPGWHLRYGDRKNVTLDELDEGAEEVREAIGDGSKYLLWRFVVDPNKREIRIHSPYMDTARNAKKIKHKLEL